MRAGALLVALPLAVVLAGCGSDGGKGASSTPSPSATPTATTATTRSACPSTPPSKDLTKKPAVSLPAGSTAPPDTTWTDIVVGTGPEAKAGANVQVRYVGVLFDTCKEFDASWGSGPGDAASFNLGQVIPGFSKAILGMRAGGRRQVVIPAKDGYGDQGTGPIPPGATLVFVIDLVKAG